MDEADYYVHQIHVKNAFAEGESCMEAYRCVYEANRRICERLGVDEDSDVELIIDSMFDITHIVAEKMFSYGVVFENVQSMKEKNGLERKDR